jgi:hypothetical protein
MRRHLFPASLVPLALVFTFFEVPVRARQTLSTNEARPMWTPIVEMGDELFPALALSLASLRVNKQSPTHVGDPAGFFGVRITCPTGSTRVRVTITIDGLSQESSLEATLPQPDQQYTVYPRIRFDVRALARTRESHPTTVVFAVSANGVNLGEETRTIQVRSVNDVPLAFRTPEGRTVDLKGALFAALVDENHPWIDTILSEALKDNAIQQFRGYQAPPQEVLHQVFAIWNVLQRHRVRYSSITQPSVQSQMVPSQHVRFLDESIRNSEANCVDGTILFASILYKLGLFPVLALKPGHMFLGFYVDQQKQHLAFLETTLIGNPGLNAVQRK